MKKITATDIIFARATVMGRELLNVRLSGIASLEGLLQALKQQLGEFVGLVSVSIRNLTQGWSQTRAYRMA